MKIPSFEKPYLCNDAIKRGNCIIVPWQLLVEQNKNYRNISLIVQGGS